MTILDYVAEGKWQKDWSTESEARRMLNTLGITDQNSNMDNLSGGEKESGTGQNAFKSGRHPDPG